MLTQAKHIYFVGIGGIGMSGLAKLLISQGKIVSGSDLVLNEMVEDLRSKGVSISIGHMDFLPDDTDLLIYSSAVAQNNPERLFADANNIPELSYAQALGEFSKGYSTIVVTGTHGKSTTTAMLGLILEAAGYDPTILVGSVVPTFEQGNVRIGKSRFFVVEGCEYRANMMNLHPEMIIVTNIEMDHPDFYTDIAHVGATFKSFIEKLSSNGIVILNADDFESKKLLKDTHITFGKNATATYQLKDDLVYYTKDSEPLGAFSLKVPGDFNKMNALASIATAMELGVPFQICVRALELFPGIWRRFEHVCMFENAVIISDYAHHPTAINATLKAVKEKYPDKRVLLCYQPHQHARTIFLFKEFVEVFKRVNIPTILCEVYDVAGRNEDKSVSSIDIIKATGNPLIQYAANTQEVKKKIVENVKSYDVIIIMGAGDIDGIARELCANAE